jgi:hypothetical protein
MAAGARGRALPAYFIVKFIYPRARFTFGIFGTGTLGFVTLSGEFAGALLFHAYFTATLFVGFGLAGGEDISRFGDDFNRRGHDVSRQPGNAAACHQSH